MLTDNTALERDMDEYIFHRLVDLAQVRQLLESHHNLSGLTYSLSDAEGNNLIAVGWQDICVRFHRNNPVSCARCRESDAYIKKHLHDVAGEFLEYHCQNGMIHIAMPLVIDGKHVATFFTTQFFYDDDRPDKNYFRIQAEALGFDQDAYLEALERVPVFSREHVRDNLFFLRDMVKMLAEMGLGNLRLAGEVTERQRAEKRLALLDFALNHVREAAFMIDENGCFRYVNDGAGLALGYSRDELLGLSMADVDPDRPSERWADHWHDLKASGSLTFEGRHRTKDGHIFPVEINANYFEHEGCGYNLALVRDIAERKRLVQEINNSREYLANIINAIADPVFVKDAEHRLVLVNDAECALAGRSREELLGRTDYDFFPKEQVDVFWRIDNQVLSNGETNINEEQITGAGGRIRTIVTHKSRYVDHLGNPFVVGVIRDITERKQAEETLQRLNRELRAISDCNHAIIRAENEQSLLSDACRIICNVAGYRMAWVGYAENDDAKTVRPVAWAGFENGYVANANITWADDTERGQGPAGKVIRGGETIYVQNFTTDPQVASWRESALQRGYRSGIALPLKDENAQVFGVLMIYSSEINAITPEEIRLMEELCGDLAFGIMAMRVRIERKRLEDELQIREQYRRALLDNFPFMVWLKDTQSRLLAVNRPYLETAGLGAAAPYFGKTDLDLFPAELAERYRADDREVMRTGQKMTVEELVGVPDQLRWHETYKAPVLDADGELLGTVGFARDISERKQTECVNMARLRLLQFAATHTLDELLQATLDEAEAVSGSLIGFYHFLEADQKTLSLQNWSTRTMAESCRAEGKGLHYNVAAAGVWVDRIHERRAVIHNDYAALPHRKGMPPEHGQVIRELVVPVLRGENIVAILGVGNKPLDYTPQDVEAVSLLADLAWDITERKRAEEALAASEREFRTLAENAPDNIARFDRHCRWIYLNPEMARTLAVDPALLLGKTPTESGPGDSKTVAGYEHSIQRVLESGEPDEIEIIMPHHTGKFHTHLIRLVAERDLAGKVAGVLAIGRDITSIKNMERELRDIQSRMSAMFSTLPDLVWLKNEQGVYLACNPAFERFFGATEAEIIGKTDHDFVDAELADFFIQKDREAMVAGTVCINEEEIVYAADGRRALLETRKMPVYGPNGHIMGVLGIGRDITEHKQAEELLRKREQEFRALAENSPDIIGRYDRECRRIYINPAMQRLFGRPAAEVLGKKPTELSPLPEVAFFEQKLREAMERDQEFQMETSFRSAEGELTWSHLRIVPEFSPDGKVISVLAIGRDITERKQMEMQLHASEQQFRALAETSPGVMYSFLLRPDGTSCMPYVSRRIEELNGLRSEEMAADTIEVNARIHPDDRDRVEESIAASARTLSPWHTEFRIRHPEKGDVWVEGHSIPGPQPDGAILWHGFLHDITERKRAEESLRRKREQLAAMAVELSLAEERERRRIASELHDHIGQTLLLGRIKLGTLAETCESGNERETYEEIRSLLDRTIRDIRSLTQQLHPPVLASVGLEAALEWLARRMEADYSLRVEFLDDLSPKPLTEELAAVVYQSARELLINVAKHAGTAEARFAVGREARMFLLRVEDRGCGFTCTHHPGEHMPLDCSFGLFNIQQRIKLLGGEVMIESAPGQGTCATIRVPLAMS